METDFPEGGDDIGQRVSISSCVARCGGECSCCHVELFDDLVRLELASNWIKLVKSKNRLESRRLTRRYPNMLR